MSIEVISVGEESRINHPIFEDVYNVIYDKGVITDFEEDGSGKLTDMCTVEAYDEEFELPIFYHCRKHCYDEEVQSLKANKALTGAARAFAVGDEVKIVIERGDPRYVVDHLEQHDPPRMCLDIFRLDVDEWFDWGHHELHYLGSQEEEHGQMDVIPTDHYGDEPLMEKEGITLFGKREFQTGTIMNFWGDFYVQVGPVFYIVRLTSIGSPLPWVGLIVGYTGVWNEEREEELIALGESAEGTIPTGVFEPLPIFPVYPDYVKELSGLTQVLIDRWRGYTKPCPRWVYTKLWGQSHEQ